MHARSGLHHLSGVHLHRWTTTGAPVARVGVSSATAGVLPTLGDANGDGRLDPVIAPDDGRPELVRIFDVDTGGLLGEVPGGEAVFPGGVRVALGVLTGGPGASELVVGNGPGGHPRVRVVFWPPAGTAQRPEILPWRFPRLSWGTGLWSWRNRRANVRRLNLKHVLNRPKERWI